MNRTNPHYIPLGLQPATLDLAEHVGHQIVIAATDGNDERVALLKRIYGCMTSAAQRRARLAAGLDAQVLS